jgi:hypothetical protein
MTTTLIHMPYDDKDRHIKIRISQLENELVTLTINFNDNDVTFFGNIQDFLRLYNAFEQEFDKFCSKKGGI